MKNNNEKSIVQDILEQTEDSLTDIEKNVEESIDQQEKNTFQEVDNNYDIISSKQCDICNELSNDLIKCICDKSFCEACAQTGFVTEDVVTNFLCDQCNKKNRQEQKIDEISEKIALTEKPIHNNKKGKKRTHDEMEDIKKIKFNDSFVFQGPGTFHVKEFLKSKKFVWNNNQKFWSSGNKYTDEEIDTIYQQVLDERKAKKKKTTK